MPSSTHDLSQGISFDTAAKIAPYKIMYLLTGGLAIMVGIAVTIWMPDSPLHAVFLSQKERVIAVERIRDDQGGTENKIIKRHQVIEAFLDIRSWMIVLLTVMSEPIFYSLDQCQLTVIVYSRHSERKLEQL